MLNKTNQRERERGERKREKRERERERVCQANNVINLGERRGADICFHKPNSST